MLQQHRCEWGRESNWHRQRDRLDRGLRVDRSKVVSAKLSLCPRHTATSCGGEAKQSLALIARGLPHQQRSHDPPPGFIQQHASENGGSQYAKHTVGQVLAARARGRFNFKPTRYNFKVHTTFSFHKISILTLKQLHRTVVILPQSLVEAAISAVRICLQKL